MTITEIDSPQALKQFVNSSVNVVVKFGAEWCGPCKRIAPDFEKLAQNTPGVKFATVDVDKVQNAPVSTVPTFLMFVRGYQVGKVQGANINAVIQMIKDKQA